MNHINDSWCNIINSLSGGELFDRIADDNYKMTEAEVIKYIRQVVSALQHMHENNIVHLDIKVSLQTFFINPRYMYLEC